MGAVLASSSRGDARVGEDLSMELVGEGATSEDANPMAMSGSRSPVLRGG
jgi:hypothetical protein